MSTHSISIVPSVSLVNNLDLKVEKILDWLQSSRIIQTRLSICIYEDLGYDIGDLAIHAVKEPDQLPFDLNTRGLEVVKGRRIFTTFQNGIDTVICPSCKSNFACEDWNFFNEWASDKSNNLICPLCKSINDIHLYKFDPEWGFSNLGFTFWNWPECTPEFLKEFQRRLGLKINVVYAHI